MQGNFERKRKDRKVVSEKLTIRDLVTIGIMDAVFIAVYWTCGMTIGMIPVVWPFLTGIAAIPSGVVIMLLLSRSPKRGAYTITGLVTAAVFFFSGSWWPMVVIFAVSSFLVDLYYSSGETRRFSRMATSYVLFTLGFTAAAYGPLALFTESYLRINDVSKYGLSQDYYGPALRIFGGPLVSLVIVIAITGGIAGAYLGKALLHKHFKKAGVA